MMFLMWEYQRTMVHLSHNTTSDRPPYIPYLSFNLSRLWIPQCIKMHGSLLHRYSIFVDRNCTMCDSSTTAIPALSFLIHIHTHTHSWGGPMMYGVGLWSESMVRKAPASIDFSDLFSFLAHSHHWAHRCFLHSFIVACEDTCGVADVGCSREITSPEIDQPFCMSLPPSPLHSHLSTISAPLSYCLPL